MSAFDHRWTVLRDDDGNDSGRRGCTECGSTRGAMDTYLLTTPCPPPGQFNYPEAWTRFWKRWLGQHSALRCSGPPCPGGCGAGAKDDLAALVRREAERKAIGGKA